MNSPTSKVNDLEDLVKQCDLELSVLGDSDDHEFEYLINEIANMIFDRFDDISKIMKDEKERV